MHDPSPLVARSALCTQHSERAGSRQDAEEVRSPTFPISTSITHAHSQSAHSTLRTQHAHTQPLTLYILDATVSELVAAEMRSKDGDLMADLERLLNGLDTEASTLSVASNNGSAAGSSIAEQNAEVCLRVVCARAGSHLRVGPLLYVMLHVRNKALRCVSGSVLIARAGPFLCSHSSWSSDAAFPAKTNGRFPCIVPPLRCLHSTPCTRALFYLSAQFIRPC